MSAIKPKILIYHNKLLPISETFIYNQSVLLQKYDAYFLGSKLQQGNRLSLPEDRVLLINSGGLLGLFREYIFKMFGKVPRNICQRINSIDPVLIHAHFAQNGAIVLPLVTKMKKPFVLSILGSDITQSEESIKKQSLSGYVYVKRKNRLIKAVDKVIVPSQFLKDKAIEKGYDPRKIVVLQHGVDTTKFKPQSKKSEYGNILFVGRLIPVKGLNFLIEAIKIVRRIEKTVFLTVIGDGPMRNTYEILAKQELVDGYEFLGALSHNSVIMNFEKAYIFCTPSVVLANGQAESFGVVFAEAQALGVPVVSFATGGIPEVVRNGESGILVKEGDVNALAESILKLLEDKDLYQKMSCAGRQRAETHFDLQRQNRELEDIYDKILIKR